MQKPLISIVVPCFNGADFLRTCVRSILQQGSEVEVIVVDDGSTDHSPVDARDLALANPGRVMVILQANQGQAAARNAGIRAAVGKYAGFLDVDDEYAPGFLRRALEILDGHANVVAVQGRIEFVDLHRPVEPWQREAMESTMPGTILARCETVRKVGGFPVDAAFRGPVAGEDGVFRRQLALFGDVAGIDQLALRYRVRRGSHFDYFLDRAVFENGRIVFRELSAQEADGSLATAIHHYREQVAVGMIARMAELSETEAVAGANFNAYQHAMGEVTGSITPVEGFALYTLARRWPVGGVTVEIGGDGGRSTCWLAAGSRASGAGKLIALEPFDTKSPEAQRATAIAQLRSTLTRLNLNNGVEVLERPAVEVVQSWASPIRLLAYTVIAGIENGTHLEPWLPLLGRHGLLVLRGTPADLEYQRLRDELQRDTGRWKPLSDLLGVAAFENLATAVKQEPQKR